MDSEDLGKRYADMSDQELYSIREGELADNERACYRNERTRRSVAQDGRPTGWSLSFTGALLLASGLTIELNCSRSKDSRRGLGFYVILPAPALR